MQIYKSLGVIFFFFLILTISHIALASTITFFHLRLEHRLFDIQSWLNDFSYEVLAFGKIFAFFMVQKVMLSRLTIKTSLRDLLKPFKETITKKDLALILMLLVANIFILRPVSSDNYWSFQLFLNYLGSLFIYLPEILLFVIVCRFYPTFSKKEQVFLALAISILSYLFLKFIFLGSPEVSLLILVNLIFLQFIVIFSKTQNLIGAIVLCMGGIAIVESFLGVGAFESSNFSLFVRTRDFYLLEFIVFYSCLLIYKNYRPLSFSGE